MSKHEKYTRLKRQIGLCLAMGVALFSAAPMAFAATSVVANNQLPTGGTPMHDTTTITPNLPAGSTMPQNPVMDITQTVQNEVIKWHDFSIGGSATVNFKGPDRHNTLNYVVGTGNISQIYGTINANNNGNIYIVNPAGVQIGNSAQINVGSLYVSTNTLDDNVLNNFYQSAGNPGFKLGGKPNIDAELMSLGNINANNVTFEGDGRIVIDTERIKDVTGDSKLTATDIVVRTNDADKLILGYDAYVDKDEDGDGSIDGYKNADKTGLATVYENGTLKKDVSGYMWIEDVEQLQAINTNLGGNYALRNSIDATGTAQNGFTSIGNYGDAFSGKFDGIKYNIFGLTITGTDNNAGLFAQTDGATINNVTLVGGSITGGSNVGAIVGNATNTTLTNVVNSAAITGTDNVGGIVGSSTNSVIKDAVNTGTIEGTGENVGGLIGSMGGSQDKSQLIGNSYNLGNVSGDGHNVGGLVGYAQNSTIGNETSKDKTKETEIVYNVLDVTGAYNVGGIVGNMENSTVRNAENRGNVTATGSTTEPYKYHKGQLVDDPTIKDNQNKEVNSIKAQENVQVANVGGIVGNSLNGTIKDVLNEGDISTVQNTINNDTYYIAGNVGGVVGRAEDTNITNATNKEANIRGAHNVGGIAGYFGNSDTTTEPSYTVTNGINNGGDILATSARDVVGNVVKELVRGDSNKENFNIGNMGGIVGYMYGDKTHITGSANRGTVHSADIEVFSDIKDSSKAANVGGIVGKIDRSKTNNLDDNIKETDDEGREVLITENIAVSNSYNTGDVKGFTGIGGVVGRLSGNIEKAYNNGAIYNGYTTTGGIAGWWVDGSITNVFNTGNITVYDKSTNTGTTSQVGGIAGAVELGTRTELRNAYNLGTIRSIKAGKTENSLGGIIGDIRDFYEQGKGNLNIENVYTMGNLYVDSGNIGSIIGKNDHGRVTTINTYYIKPEDSKVFTDLRTKGNDNSNKAIDFVNRADKEQYQYNGNNLFSGNDWRIYESTEADGTKGTTPILNAFMPNSSKYFGSEKDTTGLSEGQIQYGTAYDPLLTIIKDVDKDLKLNWNEMGIEDDGGLAVFGKDQNNDYMLTLNDFVNKSSVGFFGGMIYTGGDLVINGLVVNEEDGTKTGTDIKFGSMSDIYASSVTITNEDGDLEFYGNVTATGENGHQGNIKIEGDNVSVYGELHSAQKDKHTVISGVEDGSFKHELGNILEGTDRVEATKEHIKNEEIHLVEVSDIYSHVTNAAQHDGNITITANNGDANIYYGNEEKGIVDTAGNLTVNAGKGNVYIDSDMVIGGDLNAKANDEIVVDISNVGKVDDSQTVHDFLHGFSGRDGDKFNLISNTDNAKITVDLWDSENGQYDFRKYDYGGHVLTNEFNGLNVTTKDHVQDIVYIWVADGEQMKAIQDAVKNNDKALGYNYALMGDINASGIEDYVAIGTGSAGFTGTFDGRGNRVIGLEVNGNNAGIFSIVGSGGVVKDVNIYSGTFTGTVTAGAVAGVNNGRIEGVVTFGNTIQSTGENSNAGGIAGINNGKGSFEESADGASILTGGGIYDVESTSSVIAGHNSANAGGLVGTNNGALGNSFSDSAVTVETGGVSLGENVGLGGVVGVNNGDVRYVDSLGVTNGGDTGSSDIGGIIGINNGNMYSGYNESIVSGKDNVGGIIGTNAQGEKVENVVNATSVTGKDKNGSSENVGGLIGVNKGSVTNGRNNGTITGTTNVGGLVGDNADKNSILTNLVNDSAAEIVGIENVGGIAGNNEGTITTGKADDENEKANLINRGSITGHTHVGGVAGTNNGTIENANNDVELNVNPDGTGDAQFFGGIAGVNTGTITNATNTANVNAEGADYVGGIVGKNDGTLEDMAGNSGNVTGENFVGGVAGLNNKDIEGVNASNTGVVTANNGGAGGIFAENSGNITNSELSNNGTVTGNGGNGTGGIFGINSGDITYSSLKNEIDGKVTGTSNVGGLIGKNTGTITGGRDSSDSYYKYQIYNNGEITATGNGFNIGGLIGNNTTENGKSGSLTAGYNTGAINASGSTNVGGIAGTNEGTLDQVFSTIFDDNGDAGSVTGGTNVGGLVGNNSDSGTLSNAYNTSAVTSSHAGSLVGTNSGTVYNAYTTAGNSFFGANHGTTTNIYFADGSDASKHHGMYEGFDFDTDGSGIWKNYDGYGNPLLKVFLTKVTYNPDTGALGLPYTGSDVAPNIEQLIRDGFLTAPDDFKAHWNAKGGLIFNDNDSAVDIGTYWEYLWSKQIAFGNDSPNWLGYDLQPISYEIVPRPDGQQSGENWSFLYKDAPFDRNRDFRERKAEINFADGGMEL